MASSLRMLLNAVGEDSCWWERRQARRVRMGNFRVEKASFTASYDIHSTNQVGQIPGQQVHLGLALPARVLTTLGRNRQANVRSLVIIPELHEAIAWSCRRLAEESSNGGHLPNQDFPNVLRVCRYSPNL